MGWWSAARQAQAYNYLINNARLTPYGAAGLVSRWANVESTANGPSAVNPSSGAFGIAQWLGARLKPIRGNTNFTAQLAYVVRELNSTESRAAAVLRNARTAQDGARGASMYERAEGYNAVTGTDNWTVRTRAGIDGVLAVAGVSATPADVADSSIDTPRDISDSDTTELGSVAPGLLLAGAAALAAYLIFR